MLTEDESEGSDVEDGPHSAHPEPEPEKTDHHSFIFGYRSSDVDLRKLHPNPSQIAFLWQVFQENVDPIVKVLHVPSISQYVRNLRTDFSVLTPEYEALMFAIYYAAVASMDAQEVCHRCCISVLSPTVHAAS